MKIESCGKLGCRQIEALRIIGKHKDGIPFSILQKSFPRYNVKILLYPQLEDRGLIKIKSDKLNRLGTCMPTNDCIIYPTDKVFIRNNKVCIEIDE